MHLMNLVEKNWVHILGALKSISANYDKKYTAWKYVRKLNFSVYFTTEGAQVNSKLV